LCRAERENNISDGRAAESGGMHVKYARDEWAPAGPRGTHVDTGLVCLLFVNFVPLVNASLSAGRRENFILSAREKEKKGSASLGQYLNANK
jgi:hypothetical protein